LLSQFGQRRVRLRGDQRLEARFLAHQGARPKLGFRGASDPVSRSCWARRCTQARLTPNVAATSSASPVPCHAWNTRSRKSIEYGAAILIPRRHKYHDFRTMYKLKTL
jgi:hypothetical protein